MKSKCDDPSCKTNISLEDYIREDEPSLLNTLIADAYLKGVSEIQFEPPASQDIITVFFRIDGEMRKYMTIPYAAIGDIIKRFKVMANLDAVDCNLPKIGRIKFKHQGLPEFHIIVILRPNEVLREAVTLKIQKN
jgi:type II secretory ATPase GspE/PulE/Tfp pilus assembly ATPase PilB-like protein